MLLMRLSDTKKDKIQEQILSFLYSVSPRALFTSKIAEEIARDEEFIKKLLLEMKTKKLVELVIKNSKGKTYKKRMRWRISDKAYEFYQNTIS